ncbi:MAG: cadmium-translocating P-type ATPase [Cryobacterium sp.]|nr:cadmium-translocating P-type ATPase [Cryobacterium sp.]
MNRLGTAIRKYPIVAMTVLVAALGSILALTGLATAAQWSISGFALMVAALQAWDMVKNLIGGQWGIDALAIMAIIATVLVGEFWASLVIVLMLSGGEALEDYASGRAQRELTALLNRSPQSAHRLADDEAIEEIPATAVAVGDRLLVRPSELVPVDGVLESDSGTFDESSLTGESLPVEREKGEMLPSGSLNGESAVIIRAIALAQDSQYQRIVALVADAQESKAPLVRLADRYAVPFTAVSLLIAGLAWLFSGDPVRFAEVLVVATPCPLLIAAPVAFMGGMSRASRFGIIVKGGGTLERLSHARTVAFDKTGTLTHGDPTVVAVRPAGGFAEDELFALVAAAETHSSHVLAMAVVDAAHERGLALPAVTSAREEATNGVVAIIDGREVVVGKLGFVGEHASDAAPTSIVSGELAVYVAVAGRFAGAIVLSDRLRENAASTMSRFGKLGVVRFLMLTGDSKDTARFIADDLELEEVHAELLPQDKVQILKSIPERPVIMVGDGVNDAPVLAVADVGIAMGARGATAASESADVVIVLDDISKTADAMAIGQRTMRVALQSIWLGIALSVGLMVVGALGFLPAIVGAALQEVVDLATILNALRALGGQRAPSMPSRRLNANSRRAQLAEQK